MNNYRINKMMSQALEEAKEFEITAGEIESKYFGGISSFGASIIGSGIKPTLLFFGAKKGKFSKYEWAIGNILKHYLDEQEVDVYHYNNIDHVLDAVTALKLALRTYEKVDNQGGDNE